MSRGRAVSLLEYTLLTDEWFCLNGSPTFRPIYSLGRVVGSAGCAYLAHLAVPSFPSHLAALTWARANPGALTVPHDLLAHRPLSAAEVMDLRAAARAGVYDTHDAPLAVSYNATSNRYDLRYPNGGLLITSHEDIAVIGALLRGERFEPGFVKRALDPQYVADELAMDADARESSRRQRAASDQATRDRTLAASAARDDARSRQGAIDARPDLNLDHLFGTL